MEQNFMVITRNASDFFDDFVSKVEKKGFSFKALASDPKSSLERGYSWPGELPPPRPRAAADYFVVPERRQSYRDEYSSRSSAYSDSPVTSDPNSSLERDYSWPVELPPLRPRAAADYGSRVVPERRQSYRDEYSSRNSAYSDSPRGTAHRSTRSAYIYDSYGQRVDRPLPSYREGRPRDYDPIPGSKRPYTAVDDIPPRYVQTRARHSRARLDYELGASASHCGDAYGDRLGRPSLGYGSSRSSILGHDSHGSYGSYQGMGYGGSYSGNDVGGMYPSSSGAEYISREGDVGGSSYSSMYSNCGMSGGGYTGSGGSGSYY